MNQDHKEELLHLENCLSLIQENIRLYEAKEEAYKKEVTALFQAVKKGEGDSYGLLTAGQNILEHTQNALRKNRSALDKPYFGRIDYDDLSYETSEQLYIGKNGITKGQTDVVIVDWRAPAAGIYYENELGKGTYSIPGSDDVEICLHKKRTYDISEGKLIGYYDDDVAANDELLVKYLSQNKEAVLGDIIATIQKEQNEIIRQTPFQNIIVQGVAGSGKTTVALHRISYLLYNYENLYKPSEFCIIGSSDMLLHYIAGGLPELDVNHVRQMRMDEVFPYLMGKGWKKQFHIVPDLPDAPKKSRLSFALELNAFLSVWISNALDLKPLSDDELGLIVSAENMKEACSYNPNLSLFQMEKLLNERLLKRIRFLCSEQTAEYQKRKREEWKKYFDSSKKGWSAKSIYLAFLSHLACQNPAYDFSSAKEAVETSRFDVYDASALSFIHWRIFRRKDVDEFSQIFIDEAQDFGESVYYFLKRLLPGCYFTIMGDVSQNIRYETGMNDWEGLKKALFDSERDCFCQLLKSYRNTIEISEFAGKVLEHASQGSYKIQPVIRHGKPVFYHRTKSVPGTLETMLSETLDSVRKSGYETIAVICRTSEEADALRQQLHIEDSAAGDFHNGVMVLPVMLTKGLEFDCVILWKPDASHYGNNPREAKLLYVAITRALHELHLMLDALPSPLFEKNNRLTGEPI